MVQDTSDAMIQASRQERAAARRRLKGQADSESDLTEMEE